MKKEYINPVTAVYKLRVVTSFMTASQEHPDLGEGGDDGGAGEADSREDNINNHSNIWDNIW